MMSVNGFIEFPIGKKATAIFAGRRSWKSPIYDKIFDQFTTENESGNGIGGGRLGREMTNQEMNSYFYDLNAKISYRPSEKDLLSFSFYNGKDDLDNSINPEMPSGFGGNRMTLDMETTDLTNWGNTGASMKWSPRFSDKLYMNSLLSYSNYFSLRERSSSGDFTGNDGASNSISRGINEDNNLVDITAKIDFEYKLRQNNPLEFGWQPSPQHFDYFYTTE